MVGAIGHATLAAAGQPGLDSLIEEWARDVHSRFADVVIYIGRVHDDPAEVVIIVLFPDAATYEHFNSEKPDSWGQKFLDHVKGEVRWEEIDVDQV